MLIFFLLVFVFSKILVNNFCDSDETTTHLCVRNLKKKKKTEYANIFIVKIHTLQEPFIL